MSINVDYVVCFACGAKMKMIQWTHFKKSSCPINSIKEYREKYPDAHILSEKSKHPVTLASMISKYGETLGVEKYNAYCEKQRKKNTFEYKKEKYKWTRDQFDDYNRSRSTTLENMMIKYGETEGKIRYDSYVEKQRYTTSLEYFIEKYGQIGGPTLHKKQNLLKAHTLDVYIQRYGSEDVAISKLEEYFSNTKSKKSYSLISQKLFSILDEKLNVSHSYYATKNKEFVKYDRNTSKVYKYDYVIPELNFCIEFNGDIYHANPTKYNPSDIPKFRSNKKTALEIWKADDQKNTSLKNLGFDVIIVWESDFRQNSDGVIENIVEYVNELRIKQKLQN